MFNFKTIQRIKNDLPLNRDGINYGRVVAGKMYNLNLKELFKFLILCLVYRPQLSLLSSQNSTKLLSYNFNPCTRIDYAFIHDLVKKSSDFNVLRFDKRFSIAIVPLRFIKLIIEGANHIKFKLPIRYFFAYISLKVYYRELRRALDKTIDIQKYSLYCSFCDSYLDENLLTQMFLSKKIHTVTLQHGQYKTNKSGCESSDVESYLNFMSDYILAWNDATRQEFINAGIDGSRIVVCGVPKNCYDNNNASYTNKDDAICLFLNGDSHFESNLPMIEAVVEYCEKTKLYFTIRPHPASKRNDCTSFLKHSLFISYTENALYRFSIANTSGVIVEHILSSKKIYIFKNEKLDDLFDIEGITFKDSNDLTRLENQGVEFQPQQDIKKKFNPAQNLNEVRSNYKNFFDGLI